MKGLDSFKSVSSLAHSSRGVYSQPIDLEGLKLGLGLYEAKNLSPAELFQQYMAQAT